MRCGGGGWRTSSAGAGARQSASESGAALDSGPGPAEAGEAAMIVTDHFVFIHVSRTGGTFLNKLILGEFPGARMIQYHGRLENLPAAYSRLPVIGFARNPWDWYVSMHQDYRRKKQYVFQVLSEQGALGFERTVARFLNLGDGSGESRALLRRLAAAAPAAAAPETAATRRPERKQRPGLTSEDFSRYPGGAGYYGWLFDLMFRAGRKRRILYGRFENLREEALRLFEETGAPVTKSVAAYLKLAPPANASPCGKGFADRYSPELRALVAARERKLIARFGYEFADSRRNS